MRGSTEELWRTRIGWRDMESWLVPLAGRLYGGWLEGTWPPRRRQLALASIPLALALMALLFHQL